MHLASVMRNNESFRRRIDRDVLPSEEFANSLHNVLATQNCARNRMEHNWTDEHDVLDFLRHRPVHACTLFFKQAEDFIADIIAFYMRDNAQVVERDVLCCL